MNEREMQLYLAAFAAGDSKTAAKKVLSTRVRTEISPLSVATHTALWEAFRHWIATGECLP
jgi:hypothetical protein